MSQHNHDGLRIKRVGPDDESPALELLFAALDPAERVRRTSQWRTPFPNGPIEGLWAAWRGRRMVGAMRAQVQPGRTAFVAAPRIAADEPPNTACELLASVVEALPAAGVQVAQVLLESDHGPDVELMCRGGFRHVSDLLYLVSTSRAFPQNLPAEHLEFLEYCAERHERLARVVERTYVDSLDLRSVDGVRTTEDVLEGYRSAGDFDPARWLLVRSDGADVGCLLLSADARDGDDSGPWELTYMGVVPEARRRGFAVSMARHAQWLAWHAGCNRLVLAVDADNAPAIAAYAACGFVSWDRRSVFLRVF
jgi:ribosomal protein S18 acetylase RimI-like enzyme